MNPLLQKYEELYGKKEPPKMPHIEDYEGEETFADELKKSNFIKAENAKIAIKGNQIGYSDKTNISITKPPILKSYDLDDLKTSFEQVAEKLQNDEAQVVSMNMEFGDHMNKITFEVYLDT